MRSTGGLPRALVVGLLVVGCQAAPAPSGAGPGASTAASGASSGDPTSTSTPGGTAGIAAELVTGEGDLFLDPLEGLASVASRHATLTWSFEGTTNGQPTAWTEKWVLATATEPATIELTVERTNVPDAPARSWLAIVDGVTYEADDARACSARIAADRDRPPELAGQLSALVGGMQTGTETIDGQPTEAFTFDGRAMGLVDPVKAVGHAWVAPALELLMRYDVTIDAGPDYFGDDVTGRLTGRYDLSGIGAAVSVDVPADCPAGIIVGPQPTDATDVSTVPGRSSLHTAMGVGPALAFYRDTSLAFGWQAAGAPLASDDLAVLEFTHDGQSITVLIRADGSGSSVEVTATRK